MCAAALVRRGPNVKCWVLECRSMRDDCCDDCCDGCCELLQRSVRCRDGRSRMLVDRVLLAVQAGVRHAAVWHMHNAHPA
jgi:hypothetical protein